MSEEINYVGVLATDEEVQANKDGRFSAFINQSNAVQFNVKLISKNPGESTESNIYTGYSNNFPKIPDNMNYNDELRIEQYKNELNKYFLGFTYKTNYKGYQVIENLMLKDKISSYSDNKMYLSIPTYRNGDKIEGEHFTYSEISDILERLKENKSLGEIEGYVTDCDTPPFIIWDDGIDKFAVGLFSEHLHSNNGFTFNFNELKYIPFADNWYDGIFGFPENEAITYIEEDIYNEIIISLDGAMTYYKNEKNNDEASSKISSEEQLTEDYILEQFELITKNEGLYYDRKDLINFHTAMKTSQLVILSGMSGTGKSRLVGCYAQALGIGVDNYNIIPVRPSWNDDSDLIGFVDSMHMVYKASDTGFVDILQSASEECNKNNIYIVCLDEMNLARVEYYFSQLLSILEMPEKSRTLKLYNTDVKEKLYNSSKYKNEIKIGENIKFVGTVNIDESTFHFSDKVLDRANVISLNVVPYNTWKPLAVADKSKIKSKAITYKEYQSFVAKKEKTSPLTEQEISFLWEIHLLFNKVNKNLGVGPRIVTRIGSYIDNIPKSGELSRKEAFDLQIVQRVLTKLRGPKEQIKGILGIENEPGVTSLYDIIEKYKEISDFENTLEMLEVKKQETEIYGYTL